MLVDSTGTKSANLEERFFSMFCGFQYYLLVHVPCFSYMLLLPRALISPRHRRRTRITNQNMKN